MRKLKVYLSYQHSMRKHEKIGGIPLLPVHGSNVHYIAQKHVQSYLRKPLTLTVGPFGMFPSSSSSHWTQASYCCSQEGRFVSQLLATNQQAANQQSVIKVGVLLTCRWINNFENRRNIHTYPQFFTGSKSRTFAFIILHYSQLVMTPNHQRSRCVSAKAVCQRRGWRWSR